MAFQFCLITDHKLYRQPMHEIAQLADECGVSYFMLREKELDEQDLLRIAQHLRWNLISSKFIVNGNLAVAIAVGADGVHLQKDGIPIRAVREKYPEVIIGYSAHSLEEIQKAAAEGANYVTISPVYAPRSKSDSRTPIGTKLLAAWAARVKIPVFALGGISSENLSDIRKSGCAGAAGISLFIDEHGHFDSSAMGI